MKLYKLETWVEAPDSLKTSQVLAEIVSTTSEYGDEADHVTVGTENKPAPNGYLVPAPETKLTLLGTRYSTT